MSFQRVARRNRIHEQAQLQSLCGKCLAALPREELEQQPDGSFVCKGCLAPSAAPFETPSVRGSRRPVVRGTTKLQEMDSGYERAGVYLEYGLLIVRCVLYLVFFVAAQKSDLARNAFQGFLVADFGAWLVQSVFEFRRDPGSTILEFFFFGAVLWFFNDKGGLLTLPAAPTDRAVVGMVFIFYFSTRVVFYILRRRYEGDGAPGTT